MEPLPVPPTGSGTSDWAGFVVGGGAWDWAELEERRFDISSSRISRPVICLVGFFTLVVGDDAAADSVTTSVFLLFISSLGRMSSKAVVLMVVCGVLTALAMVLTALTVVVTAPLTALAPYPVLTGSIEGMSPAASA